MKKIIALMLVVVFVFTLCACNSKNTVSETDTSTPISSETFVKPENYTSVLLVSINPQFKLYLDENNMVLEVEPVNDDAKSFCESIDFKNQTVETVVGNIVEKANEKGFIKANVTVDFEITEQKDGFNNSDILTKVVSAANQKASELNIEIKTETKEKSESETIENSEATTSSQPEETTKKEESTSKPTTTTKPTESKPTHTHEFSAATCAAPQKCSCGETKGFALGHKWQDATCQAPKTCSVCKTIEGNKLKHTYDEDGICSLCKSKDPNFKYPAVSSMDGNWKSVHKQENYLCELTYHFTLNPPKDLLPFGAGEWGYFPEEEMQLENNESLDDYESIVWTDGKTYYKLGGGMVMEGIFEESDDKVIVTDYYSNNKKMVLQRISTNRMKVISFDSQIEYVNIPIGTILTFCEK